MYYAVENEIFFYDIENMKEESKCSSILKTEEEIVNSFNGIQIINLGAPYLHIQKKLMVTFHTNQVKLYQFELFLPKY